MHWAIFAMHLSEVGPPDAEKSSRCCCCWIDDGRPESGISRKTAATETSLSSGCSGAAQMKDGLAAGQTGGPRKSAANAEQLTRPSLAGLHLGAFYPAQLG